MRSPIQVPTRPGAAGLHLRLSRFPAVTHPIADRARCCWTTSSAHPVSRFTVTHPTAEPGAAGSSAVPFSGGHPSHCRCCLTPLQVVTHPSAVLARFSWTTSSAVPFSGGHPSHCRPSPVLLDASIVSSSGGHPSKCRPGPVLLDFIFGCSISGGHPSHCRPSPLLLDLFLRLSPLQVVTHPSADLARFSWTSSSAVPFSGGHPSHCRHGPAPVDFIFGCPVFRRSPIPPPTEPGAA